MRSKQMTRLRAPTEPPTIVQMLAATTTISEWLTLPTPENHSRRELPIVATKRGRRIAVTVVYPWPGWGEKKAPTFTASSLSEALILAANEIANGSPTDAT